MIFPYMKSINTELFIDKKAALYMQKGAGKHLGFGEEGKIVGAKQQKR